MYKHFLATVASVAAFSYRGLARPMGELLLFGVEILV